MIPCGVSSTWNLKASAAAGFDGRYEGFGETGAGRGVQAVGCHHQVVLAGQLGHVRRAGAEADVDAQLPAALLQDRQQPLAAHRGEPVAARRRDRAAVVHVDVVPAREFAAHRLVHPRVGVLDAAERLVGEHHAEAERVVRRVALPDRDLVPGPELLREGGEVQARRAAAENRYPHNGQVMSSELRSSRRR
jgi:hypothetical protein